MDLYEEIKAMNTLSAKSFATGYHAGELDKRASVDELVGLGVALGLTELASRATVMEAFFAGCEAGGWEDGGL